MIIFTKKDDSEFRNVVESLATAMSSVGLGILSTIVLYENGIKPGTGVLSQHYVHLKFPNDPIATAGLISGYIEASRMAKGKFFFVFFSSRVTCMVKCRVGQKTLRIFKSQYI